MTGLYVTVLLLPVVYFGSRWGFESLHQWLLARVALTEYQRRTHDAERQLEDAKTQLDAALRVLESIEPRLNELEKTTGTLRTGMSFMQARK